MIDESSPAIALAAQMSDTVLITEADPWTLPGPRIVYANPAFVTLTGYSLDELIGCTPRILQGPNTERAELDRIQAAIAERRTVRSELTNYAKDGTEIYLELEISPCRLEPEGPLYFMAIGRDISQRYLNNRALQRNEERLRLALQGGDLGFWDWDFLTGDLVVNERWLAMLGMDITNLHPSIDEWQNRVHPEDIPKLDRIVADIILMPQGGNFEVELRARHSDGRYRWILDRGVVVERDRAGLPLRVSGTHMDITERKNAERLRLQHAEMLSRISDAVISTDLQLQVRSWNRAAELMYGWTAESALGRNIDQLLETEFIGTTQEAAQELLHFTGLWKGELKQTRNNGNLIIVQATVLLLTGPDGSASGGITVNHDVTALRLAEAALAERSERFSALLAFSDGIVWEAQPGTMNFSYVSGNAERLFGYPVQDWLIPGFWKTHVHPDDRDRVINRIAESSARALNHESEYRFATSDGHFVWVRAYIKYGFQDGTLARMSGLLVDISNSKLEAERAKAKEQQLREAQKLQAIGTLAAGIAHELNNMLASVLGNVELALMDIEPRHVAYQSIEEIHQAALNGRNVLKQILAFSKKHPLSLEALKVQEVIAETLRFLSSIVPPAIRIQMELALQDATVWGDRTQLQQVFVNLLNNAMQAMPDSKGVITIRLFGLSRMSREGHEASMRHSRVGDMLQRHPRLVGVTIADNGAGMSPDILKRVFEPFYTTKPAGQGTGLGLSVVHGIVENHAGLIFLESSNGAGTEANLYFPFFNPESLAVLAQDGDVHGADDAPTQNVEPSSVSRQGSSAPESAPSEFPAIVLVDDNAAITSFLQRALIRRGITSHSFNSGEQALEFTRNNRERIALVVTDHLMPEMDGLELAAALKQHCPDLPVLILSGNITQDLNSRAQSLGVSQVLPKGESSEELLRAIFTFTHPALGGEN